MRSFEEAGETELHRGLSWAVVLEKTPQRLQKRIDPMATLKEDIKSGSDWIVEALASDGFKLDYTIDSIIEVDRFFTVNMKDGKPTKGGRLYGRGYGPKIFALGSYVGETIIQNVNGAEWITDDNDPQAELNVFLKLPNESQIWPIKKVMKRFQNGAEEALYPYVYIVTKEFTDLPFNEEFWSLTVENGEPDQIKPWWKFW